MKNKPHFKLMQEMKQKLFVVQYATKPHDIRFAERDGFIRHMRFVVAKNKEEAESKLKLFCGKFENPLAIKAVLDDSIGEVLA